MKLAYPLAIATVTVTIMAMISPVLDKEPMIDLRFTPSRSIDDVQGCLAWVIPEVWARYCLDQRVAVDGETAELRVMARRSNDKRQVSLFLRNESPQLISVRVHPAGATWKFTGQGQWIEDVGNSAQGSWRLVPSMPLPLPKVVTLESMQLVVVNLTDMNPQLAPKNNEHER